MRVVRRRTKLWRAFYTQRYGAKERGVPFLLSFLEWWQIWVDSGHLHERGHYKGQYVMARYGDKGPYAVGNVKIITCSDNTSEGNKGKIIFDETRARLSKANRGKVLPPEQRAKIGASSRGRKNPPLSLEHRAIISEYNRGKVLSPETRAKISAAAKARYERARQARACTEESG